MPDFMVKKILTLVLTLSVAFSFAQSRPGSIKGTVKDKRTGEVIPFATVVCKRSRCGRYNRYYGF